MSQMSIQVTDCRIFPNARQDDRLKAYGSIVLNDAFALDVKVINGLSGMFVAMPALPRKDGLFHDVAHPITRELREHIEAVVLGAYRQEIGQSERITRTAEAQDRSRQQHQPTRRHSLVGAGA